MQFKVSEGWDKPALLKEVEEPNWETGKDEIIWKIATKEDIAKKYPITPNNRDTYRLDVAIMLVQKL